MRKCVATLTWLVLLASAAAAQTLVLDDSLRGSTSGARAGGAFQADGWRVTNKNDSITWHIPTLPRGAAEWSVRGLRPNDARPEGADKNELFHMYDWTYNNADTVYDGYRNNPYKHFVRKINVLDSGKTDMMELVWAINGDYIEPDTSRLSWDPNVAYRFREEWGPDGTGRSVIRTYRDGALVMTMAVSGTWSPAGHAVRIAASTRAPLYPDFGAPVDAVFSDVKVWDLSGTPPPPPPPTGTAPRVGLSGDRFTLNGQPTFLLGVSYFDGANWHVSDLDALAARRFNLIRIWLDWGLAGDGRSFFDASGALVKRSTLQSLVRAAGARGMAVDVTILDPTPTFGDLHRALREAVSALRDEPNVFFDVMNEHDHPAGPRTHSEVAQFISTVKATNPAAIVTVSGGGGHLMDTRNVDEELNAGIMILTPHFDRTSDWYDRTDDRTRFLKNHLASRGRNIPVYLQEEARRGHSGLNPSRDEFFQAAREARDAGAAGWIFHTRAGFDLNIQPFFQALDSVEREVVDGLANVIFGAGAPPPPPPGGPTSLATGWEDGEPLGNSDLVLYSKDVAGYFNSSNPPPECSRRSGETQRTGSHALMVAGYSNAAYAYCYYKLFDDDIPVQAGTRIKYWIWHLNTPKVAIDGHFTDGSTIRDGGFTDQNGVRIHPDQRTDPLGTWTYVEVDLSAAAGKTLDFILVGFDNGGDGFTGPYRAYIDDFSIGTDAAPPPPPAPSGPFVSVVSIATGGPTSIDTAQAGALPYSDRSYQITAISSRLNGGVLVRIPNNDKYNRSASYLTLNVTQDAFVYVAYDRRGISVMPRWLDDEAFWSLTGESLSTSDSGASPMSVFYRRASPGNVTLGGNWEGRDTGAHSNYVVIVQPADGRSPGGGAEDAGVLTFVQQGPLASDAYSNPGDSDGDGLYDSFEQAEGLNPADIFTRATGVPDEVALHPSGRTYFEVQSGGPTSAGGGEGGGSGGGGGGCGALGLEGALLLLLRRRGRRA
jgi:hypothetical protein